LKHCIDIVGNSFPNGNIPGISNIELTPGSVVPPILGALEEVRFAISSPFQRGVNIGEFRGQAELRDVSGTVLFFLVFVYPEPGSTTKKFL